jgi:alpha-tubulin suppressor-like RCC1 family protein
MPRMRKILFSKQGNMLMGILAALTIISGLVVTSGLMTQSILLGNRVIAGTNDVENLKSNILAVLGSPDACGKTFFPVWPDDTWRSHNILRTDGSIHFQPGHLAGKLKIAGIYSKIPTITSAIGIVTGQLRVDVVSPTGTEDADIRSYTFNVDLVLGGRATRGSGVFSRQVFRCHYPGDPTTFHLAFNTNALYQGNLGGIPGADAKCQTAANNVGFGGTWQAIISDSSYSAKSRVRVMGPIFNMKGELVADSANDLWDGKLQKLIRYNENYSIGGPGGYAGGDYAWGVWTGTNPDGRKNTAPSGANCTNWTSASSTPGGVFGDSLFDWKAINILGTDDPSTSGCNNAFQLYCINVLNNDHIVFISSQAYNGNLGGLAGADAKCQVLATAADLPGNYGAILSDDTVPAIKRVPASGRFVTPLGDVVAYSASELWHPWGDMNGPIRQRPINVTESGGTLTAGVWSATQTDGAISNGVHHGETYTTCQSWNSSVSAPVDIGSSFYSNWAWIMYYPFSFPLHCNESYHLYCVQDVINYPSAELSTGALYTCAKGSDSTMKCWGENWFGQLGTGNTSYYNTPQSVLLGAGRTLKALPPGSYTYHNCAILDDNSLKCWGMNDYGQIGNGSTWATTNTPPGITTPTLVNVGFGRYAKAVALGERFTCAILDDNSARCWGQNLSGQLGNGSFITSTTPVVVNLGAGRTAKMIRAGIAHACAILDDNSLKCWGENDNGQLGNGTIIDSSTPLLVNLGLGRTAKYVGVGQMHSCAILDDNSLKCWGFNNGGQLGLGYMSGGPPYVATPTAAVNFGGTLYAKVVTAGGGETCAILSDNSLKCWGYNNYGQLGQGNVTGSSVPLNVDLGSASVPRRATKIAVGLYHACASLDNGDLKCWGWNNYGQLGIGNSVGSRGDEINEMGNNLQPVSMP